jgi:hypothetical protein
LTATRTTHFFLRLAAESKRRAYYPSNKIHLIVSDDCPSIFIMTGYLFHFIVASAGILLLSIVIRLKIMRQETIGISNDSGVFSDPFVRRIYVCKDAISKLNDRKR